MFVCMCVCVCIELNITAQSGPVILVILFVCVFANVGVWSVFVCFCDFVCVCVFACVFECEYVFSSCT